MSFWKIVRLPLDIALLPVMWVKNTFGGRCFRKRSRLVPTARFATKAPWKTPPPTTYPKLEKNIEADVVVIGGGITGLTAALRLAEEKKRVVVIESRDLAGSTSSYSTANLYVAIEPMFSSLKSKFNQDVVTTVINARQSGIDEIEKTIKKYNIDCGFVRRPMWYFTQQDSKIKTIKDEISTYRDAGVTCSETKDLPLDVDFKFAAVIDNQARFQPFQYLHAIASRIQELGGQIYEQSPVMKITDKDGVVTLETETHQIKAKKAFMATHATKGRDVYNTLTYSYRSYAVGVKLADHKYPNANVWHIDSPFFTLSTHNLTNDPSQMDLLIVCGNSHKVGEPSESDHQSHFETAKKYAQKHFKVESIPYEWSAQHYRSADGLPYIGKSPHYENVYMGTGYHADGLVYGVVAGLICSDQILGRNTHKHWADVFNPSRLTLNTVTSSAPKFVQENMKVGAEYMKGYLAPAEASSFDEVKNGEGKLVRQGPKKWATYRDEDGKLHVVSSVCPHLYGIVQWNDAEKTWDCPCHGSRFAIDGEVIEGCAMHPLPKYQW